jgi:hypothetical protein
VQRAAAMVPAPATAALALLLLAPAAGARADMIDMRDYTLLRRGMTEAEVLYRVGPYDHQSVFTDYHHSVVRKVWYYIPRHDDSDGWITEIEFDQHGIVQSLERYRARK